MILIVLPPIISNVVGEIGRSSWYLVKIPHSGAKTPFIFVKMRMLLYIYYIMSTYKVIAILIPALVISYIPSILPCNAYFCYTHLSFILSKP